MAEALQYEAVQIGDNLPEMKHDAVTRVQLVKWVAGSGDFNPIHFDVNVAAKQGHKDVIIPGVYKAEVADKFLMQLAGKGGHICNHKCTYTGIDLVDNTLTFKGTVTDKYEEDEAKKVVFTYVLVNQEDKVTVKGSAVLALA